MVSAHEWNKDNRHEAGVGSVGLATINQYGQHNREHKPYFSRGLRDPGGGNAGQRSPEGSKSPPGAKGVGMLNQVPTASNGDGKSTAVGGTKQALDGGRKATEVTATVNGRIKDTDMRKATETGKDQDTDAMAPWNGGEKSGGLTSSSTTTRSINICLT